MQQITDLPKRPPPPPLMNSLIDRCFGYLAPVFLVTDLELMQTAGMDALVRQREGEGVHWRSFKHCSGCFLWCAPGTRVVDPRSPPCTLRLAHTLASTIAVASTAQMLCRFISLGIQVFLPITGVCCAVIIPLAMTGTVVDNAQYANVAATMRYTLSNIEQGSGKLWCVRSCGQAHGGALGRGLHCLSLSLCPP